MGARHIVLTFAGLLAACTSPPPSGALLFADEAHAEAAADRSTLIDVRLPRERRDPRFAANTLAWIPFDRSDPERFAASIRTAVAQDSSRPIVLICEIGERSAFARQILLQAGFTNVSSVDDGYRAWHADGLPLLQSPRQAVTPVD
jgi:rhodanese-related sulfurtransferase